MYIIFNIEESQAWNAANKEERRQIMNRMLDVAQLLGTRNVSFGSENGEELASFPTVDNESS
jgi:hypothetical protein